MLVRQRRKELEIHLDGKKLKHREFCLSRGVICGDGYSEFKIGRNLVHYVALKWYFLSFELADHY